MAEEVEVISGRGDGLQVSGRVEEAHLSPVRKVEAAGQAGEPRWAQPSHPSTCKSRPSRDIITLTAARPEAAAVLTLMLVNTVVWPRGQRSVHITVEVWSTSQERLLCTRACVCVCAYLAYVLHTHTLTSCMLCDY